MNTEVLISDLHKSAKFITTNVKIKPKVGIICGTGLGFLAEEIQDAKILPYKSIPHFPVSTTKGHLGNLVFGYIANIPVMCLQGRHHFFEGYFPQECAIPIRIMKILGITNVIISNSAGSLNSNFRVGDIMLIKDHINMLGLSGFNPLRGPNLDSFGERFPVMNGAYCPKLIKFAHELAAKENFTDDLREGVYGCVSGPNFETAAEVRMLKMIGMDAVGMSTVPEVLTAKHCGMTVFAFSIITNVCIQDYEEEDLPSHDTILDVAQTKHQTLKKLVVKVIQRMIESK